MPPMADWTQIMEGNIAHYTYRRKHSIGHYTLVIFSGVLFVLVTFSDSSVMTKKEYRA